MNSMTRCLIAAALLALLAPLAACGNKGPLVLAEKAPAEAPAPAAPVDPSTPPADATAEPAPDPATESQPQDATPADAGDG